MRIELDELILFDRPDAAFDGNGFSTLDGWDDVTDSKDEFEERAQGDGAFESDPDEDWRASRVMTLKAFFAGQDFRQAQRRRQELAAIFRRGRILMRVTDDFSSSWRWVKIARAPIPRTSSRKLVYTADIVAVDPNRYEDGDPVTTGLRTRGTGLLWPIRWPINWGIPGDPGRVTLSNPGTAEAWPEFTVDGGIQEGFELERVGTGEVIRYDQTLLIGSRAVIDPAHGTVFVDGVSRSTFLTRRDWFAVPAGGSLQVQFRALGEAFGTPTLTALVNPTYA